MHWSSSKSYAGAAGVRISHSSKFKDVIGRALVAMFIVGFSSANGDGNPIRPVKVIVSDSRRVAQIAEVGLASYYADKYHGRPTASGELFDMHQLTAAHPRYAFGTRVKVTHLGSNRSIVVRINDRGPFVNGRVIDLSLAGAEELQMVKDGIARVKLEIVE